MAPSKLGKALPSTPPPSRHPVPRNSSMPDLQALQRASPGLPSPGPTPLSTAVNANYNRSSSNLSNPALVVPATPSATGKPKRRSWLSGMSRDKDKSSQGAAPVAWIAGQPSKVPYKPDSLMNGTPVTELWDETGDTFVYLHPRNSGKGPSFKIHSTTYHDSKVLYSIAQGLDSVTSFNQSPRLASSIPSQQQDLATPPRTPKSQSIYSESPRNSIPTYSRQGSMDNVPSQVHLYLYGTPKTEASSVASGHTQSTLDSRIEIRNLFAFLLGQYLIATEQRPTIFSIFLSISRLLSSYGFTNSDGSTYGTVAERSFDRYIKELDLCDVRTSREKTIEALVVGERMRSIILYNEAFTHAAGKYDAIQQIASHPDMGRKYNLLSSMTRNRLERASIDLDLREKTIHMKLVDFDFPSVFAGVMNSKTVSERKYINFDAWKVSFSATRRYVLGYYRNQFGSWPPKASSKKNDLETGGLNRLVLNTLYCDFCSMYDLYVDRASPTPRAMGQLYSATADEETKTNILDNPVSHILRRVCDEYDRSSPPVQPPPPFDIPLLPNIHDIAGASGATNVKITAADRMKKLKEDQIQRILRQSTNSDSRPTRNNASSFVSNICAFEHYQARGCSISELIDLRSGMWLFMYAVLQALPMLVIDAPELKFHHGVEYFLCQPPRGALPWVKTRTDSGAKGTHDTGWYRISGSNGLVSLPSDLVAHGVEGVYHRSHCWNMASKWKLEMPAPGPGKDSESERRSRARKRSLEQGLPPPPQLTMDRTGAPVLGAPATQPPLSVSAPSSRPSSQGASPGVATRSHPRRQQRGTSTDLGLEALPILGGSSPARDPQTSHWTDSPASSRPVSRNGPPESAPVVATTFEGILGSMQNPAAKNTLKRSSMK